MSGIDLRTVEPSAVVRKQEGDALLGESSGYRLCHRQLANKSSKSASQQPTAMYG